MGKPGNAHSRHARAHKRGQQRYQARTMVQKPLPFVVQLARQGCPCPLALPYECAECGARYGQGAEPCNLD